MLSITKSCVSLLFLTLIASSCKKSNSLDTERKNIVEVKTLSAIPMNTPISGRENWNLFLGNIQYRVKSTIGKIVGEPVAKPYEFIVGIPSDISQSKEHQVNVYFFSPGYVTIPEILKVKEGSPYPSTFDQTDLTKLKAAD